MENKKAIKLLDKYLDGNCTPEERMQVEKAYNLEVEVNGEEISEEKYADMKADIWAGTAYNKTTRSIIPLWKKLTAAASIFIFTGIASYFYFKPVKQASQQSQYVNDIPGGSNKAILILADGKKISLNEALKGELVKQEGVSIAKAANGQLVYKITETYKVGSRPSFNTLETPRGGQYQSTLPDGTRVWLNAASSLKFPTSFANNPSRNVELSGEAYFDVTKDKARPFIVRSGGQAVEVLGTQFNVNAYTDEHIVKTTLLEGAVKVTGKTGMKLLVPGQQARLTSKGMTVSTDIDLEEVVSWRNGYFKFNENLQSIMSKISRWYDVEVVYQGNINPEQTFSGEIARTRNISALLKIMESTGNVHFKVEGRRVTVMQ